MRTYRYVGPEEMAERSAGEITFEVSGDSVGVTAANSQSTGYCPEPESWTAVAAAVTAAGLATPAARRPGGLAIGFPPAIEKPCPARR